VSDQRGRLRRAGTAAALLAALAACAGVLFTAPPGSSMRLLASPPFVPANGGVSIITAILTEPAGTPVADGTIMLCFSDIGHVDPQGKTKNGIARVNFVSDSRSGIATITCLSGGEAPTPIASASPGTGGGGGGGGGTSGNGAGTVTVTVGNALVTAVRLRADPPRITISNSTHVFALVVGPNGNPLANVPVYFSIVPPSAGVDPGTEFFDVTGPVFTNNNGEAENVMRTRRQTAGTAQVKASAPGPMGFVDSDPLLIPIL
jgi:hypothetical protein